MNHIPGPRPSTTPDQSLLLVGWGIAEGLPVQHPVYHFFSSQLQACWGSNVKSGWQWVGEPLLSVYYNAWHHMGLPQINHVHHL
jgi:hypothetical protein